MLVIALGSGGTLHAVAGRPEINRITSIEIVRAQLPTLEALSRRVAYGGLQALLTNPRIEHVIGDGRIHLMRGTEGYDIIEADALRPGSACAGNLYSDEFFRLVRARLRPGGLAATWVPTERVRSTFLRAFPYVVSLPQVMVGSNTAIELDRGSIAARLGQSAVERYYRSAGIDIARLFEEFLAAPVTIPRSKQPRQSRCQPTSRRPPLGEALKTPRPKTPSMGITADFSTGRLRNCALRVASPTGFEPVF